MFSPEKARYKQSHCWKVCGQLSLWGLRALKLIKGYAPNVKEARHPGHGACAHTHTHGQPMIPLTCAHTRALPARLTHTHAGCLSLSSLLLSHTIIHLTNIY